MNNFFQLGDRRYALDVSKSSLSADQADEPFEDKMLLSLEMHPDPASFWASEIEEDSPWGWAGYPPVFYLRDYLVDSVSTGESFSISISDDFPAGRNFELALYLGEHNQVTKVFLKGVAWSEIQISGSVDAMGKKAEFLLQYSSVSAQPGVQADRP